MTTASQHKAQGDGWADPPCVPYGRLVRAARLPDGWDRVQTVVREALEKAIARVLTPKRSTDILREIMAAKATGR